MMNNYEPFLRGLFCDKDFRFFCKSKLNSILISCEKRGKFVILKGPFENVFVGN